MTGCVLVGTATQGSRPATAAAAPFPAWANTSISTVIAHGLVPGVTTPAEFRPADPLDGTTLNTFVTGLFRSRRLASAWSPVNPALQSIGSLDKTFVVASGLTGSVARAVRGARAAGYHTVRGAGMEAAARMLRLRYGFPSSEDNLEKSSREIASRADAAYSASVVLGWEGWESQQAKATLGMLAAIPSTVGERHAMLTRALSKLGMPYVWGGESDTVEGSGYAFGPQAHGGYDCSGFVWRVVALDPSSPVGALARIGGRTTFEIARTTPTTLRIPYARLQPGDLMLFGDNGPASTYDQIGHMGIYLGNNLMIHSSSQGVMVSATGDGWYRERFAFGKSVVPRGAAGRRLASVANIAAEVPAGVDPTAGQNDVGPSRHVRS